jgi:hypothetical protein
MKKSKGFICGRVKDLVVFGRIKILFAEEKLLKIIDFMLERTTIVCGDTDVLRVEEHCAGMRQELSKVGRTNSISPPHWRKVTKLK